MQRACDFSFPHAGHCKRRPVPGRFVTHPENGRGTGVPPRNWIERNTNRRERHER
jgi:hypothetical protein